MLPASVFSAEFEIHVGQSQYSKSENGIWYQDGFANEFDLDAPSVGFGFTDYLVPGIRWHAGYVNLGKVSSTALAVPDAQYNGINGCHSKLCELDRYDGEGSLEGIYLTVAPEVKIGAVKAFVEGGAWGYIPHINIKVYRGTTSMSNKVWDVTTDEHMQFGAVIGFGFEYDKTQIIETRYTSQVSNVEPNTIPFWNGHVTNISIRRIF